MATNNIVSLHVTNEDGTVVAAVSRALRIAEGNKVKLTVADGKFMAQAHVVYTNGLSRDFYGVKSVTVDANANYVYVRPSDPELSDSSVVVNSPTEKAMAAVRDVQATFAKRNALKAAAKKAEKAATLQRTDVWYCHTYQASDFVESFELGTTDVLHGQLDPNAGFTFRKWKGNKIPTKANTYLAGLLYDGLPEMGATNNLVANNGMVKDCHLTKETQSQWPLISVEFDLIKVEKKLLNKRATELGVNFNAMLALHMTECYSGKVWGALWDEDHPLMFNIAGVMYRAFVQSAAHAKIGKCRVFCIREDLYSKAMAFVLAGMDEATFIAEKHSRIKPWFYRGLMFTGLTRRYSYEQMLPWYKRTVVLPDAEVRALRKQWLVDKDGSQKVVNYDGMDKVTDGTSFMRQDFCDFLQSDGLEKDFCLSRLKPAGKGKLELDKDDVLPRTGKTPKDVWGNTHDWADVSIVLTESYVKHYAGYTSWEQYLEAAKPNFGWVQPSARTRTLNGQCLDGLLLTPDEKLELAELDCKYYDSVVQEAGDFNWDAASKAMMALAQEGFTPQNWRDMKPADLAKKLRQKMADWERGSRRAMNTMHYNRPRTVNQYLGCDAAVYAGFSRLRTRKIGNRVYEEVNCIDVPAGLVVLQRNPSACGLENAVCYNVCDESWGLSGVVHLMSGGATAYILSGADFDGDQVIVSQDKKLLQFVLRMPEGMEIAFPKKKPDWEVEKHDPMAAVKAAFGEMQNTFFQGGAQNAARALASDNWKRHSIKWAVMKSRFFSAVMQLGVDAGKYGYEMWEAWQEAIDAFLFRGYKLPGWKWTKSAKAGHNRVFDEMRDRLEIKLGRVPTDHEVFVEIADKYMVSKVYAKDGKTVIGLYDPLEIRASVVGGEFVTVCSQKFGAEAIEAKLPDLADLYVLYWNMYKDENADVVAE